MDFAGEVWLENDPIQLSPGQELVDCIAFSLALPERRLTRFHTWLVRSGGSDFSMSFPIWRRLLSSPLVCNRRSALALFGSKGRHSRIAGIGKPRCRLWCDMPYGAPPKGFQQDALSLERMPVAIILSPDLWQ
jgi:hypothetical protein